MHIFVPYHAGLSITLPVLVPVLVPVLLPAAMASCPAGLHEFGMDAMISSAIPSRAMFVMFAYAALSFGRRHQATMTLLFTRGCGCGGGDGGNNGR